MNQIQESGRNLLTEEGLTFIKEIENELLSVVSADGDISYDNVCLKEPVNSSIFDDVEVTNETVLQCALPSSPLSYYYGSIKTENSYFMYGDRFYDILETSNYGNIVVAAAEAVYELAYVFNPTNVATIAQNIPVVAAQAAVATEDENLIFDGRGDVLAPCYLNSSMLKYVAEQESNFECLLDPYTALDEESLQQIVTSIASTEVVLNDDEASALGHPFTHVQSNATTGSPGGFCSQCGTISCFCSSNTTTDTDMSVQSRIDSISSLMADSAFLSFFFGAEFSESNLESGVMLSTLSFGGPLEGFLTVDEGENGSFFDAPGPQTSIFTQWSQEGYRVLDEHGYNGDGDIEIIYFWSVALSDVTLDLLIHDILLVIGSVAFVFIYMWFHTQSCCLSFFGLLHIFASLPIAFLIYTYLFQIEPFYTLTFLSVYIILAIGADDVFVMVDAWKQMGHLPPTERLGKAFSRASKAMLITSATTAAAFLATAFSPLLDVSTFGLYTACLVISNYLAVITYYLGVIMFFHLYFEYGCCCFNRCKTAIPARKCCECLNCGPSSRRKQLEMRLEDQIYQFSIAQRMETIKTQSLVNLQNKEHLDKVSPSETKDVIVPVDDRNRDRDGDADLEIAKKEEDTKKIFPAKKENEGEVASYIRVLRSLDTAEPELPILEKFCGESFFKFLMMGPVKFILPIVIMCFTIVMAYCASQLGPTTVADPFLPDWHPIQRFIDVYQTDFGTTSDTDMKVINVVFGLEPSDPMDRSEFGRFELDMGTLNYYGGESVTCDFAEPDLQQAVYDVCAEFASLTPTGLDTSDNEVFLTRQGSGLGELEVNCWQLQFATWFEENYIGETFPCGGPGSELDNCTDIIMEFAYTWDSVLSNEDFSDRILQKDGKIAGTSFAVNGTIGYYSVVYSDVKSSFEAWEHWVSENLADHELECMRSAMHIATDGGDAWVFLVTQDLLMSGAFTGAGISLAVAFLVLWLATGNIIVTAVATLNMLCVTTCIMGMMYTVGWELGTIESISATVLVGLSVDYVVHIAQAYVEADAVQRIDRVRSALYEMGGTVFGGAITSLGASGMLFGCYLVFFKKFGGFMFMTIGFSFLFCFCFFLPLMLIMGPNRNMEIDGKLYDCASLQSCCKRDGMEPPNVSHIYFLFIYLLSTLFIACITLIEYHEPGCT